MSFVRYNHYRDNFWFLIENILNWQYFTSLWSVRTCQTNWPSVLKISTVIMKWRLLWRSLWLKIVCDKMVAIVMSSGVTSLPEMLKNTIRHNKMEAVMTKNRIRQNGGNCDATGCDVTAIKSWRHHQKCRLWVTLYTTPAAGHQRIKRRMDAGGEVNNVLGQSLPRLQLLLTLCLAIQEQATIIALRFDVNEPDSKKSTPFFVNPLKITRKPTL